MFENAELPSIGHIGYIVQDIETTVRWYKLFFNTTDFIIYDFIPLRAWVNEQEIFDCKLKIGVGVINDGQKIELIRPISGETTPHMIFLKTKGENIHHIAFTVNDYNQWKDYFLRQLEANIIFEAEAEDPIIGYRRCFYANFNNAAGIVEISEFPWKR